MNATAEHLVLRPGGGHTGPDTVPTERGHNSTTARNKQTHNCSKPRSSPACADPEVVSGPHCGLLGLGMAAADPNRDNAAQQILYCLGVGQLMPDADGVLLMPGK